MNKQCPMCGEYIEETDIICKYCGYDTTTVVEKTNYGPLIKFIILLTVFIALCIVAYNVYKVDSHSPVISTQEETKKEVVGNDSLFSSGLKAYNNNDYDTAAEKFDGILNSNDSNRKSEANYYMGMIYKSRDLIDSAQKSFKKALELDPNYAEPQKELMTIALNENDLETAYGFYSTLLDKKILSNKEIVEIFNTLAEGGICYDTDDCPKLSQKILAIDKTNRYAITILLNEYKDKGDQKLYAEYLNKYLRNIEYSQSGAIELYNIYYNSEYYTKALEVLDMLEQHGYNSYQIERAREHVKQKREEYKEGKE